MAVSLLLNDINDRRSSRSVITGYFYPKCSKWYPFDQNNSAVEPLQTFPITAGYSQLINKPIHCITGSLSCIKLTFTFNTNLVTDS